ncbi:hypothetical protein C8R48DRAFT_622962 [Suillus tomentosus]|nr:hypothetical protein C8R48DRAFT_622962 [Suillus tomentosus]
MTIATVGWVCGAVRLQSLDHNNNNELAFNQDTKLIDCILLRHLLDLTQAKLAKLARLSAPPGTNRATQSILWQDALGTTHVFAERLQTAQRLLNRTDTQLDSATVQFMADAKGMDLAIQKSSAIRETGDLVAHPKPGAICQEAFIQSISRHNVTEERPGLLAMVKFVMIGTVRS